MSIYYPPYCRTWWIPSKSIAILISYVFCIQDWPAITTQRWNNINTDIFPIISIIVTKLLQQDLCNSLFPTLEARACFQYGHPKKQFIISTSYFRLSLASKSRVKREAKAWLRYHSQYWNKRPQEKVVILGLLQLINVACLSKERIFI